MQDSTLGAIESRFPNAGSMLRSIGFPIRADLVEYLSHQIAFICPVHLTETDRVILSYLYLCQPMDWNRLTENHKKFLDDRALRPTQEAPVDAVKILYKDKKSTSIPSILGFIIKLKDMELVEQVGKGKGRYFIPVEGLSRLLTTDYTQRLLYFVEA